LPKICYVPKRFTAPSVQIIEQANEIIAEYSAQGFDLTLRQLYYQFVSRDLISNQQKEYKRLGSIINDARLSGMIDWDSIEDRTRNLQRLSHWNSPSEILETCASQFKFDRWKYQEYRVEVWIEKDALVGVIEDVCNKHDVPYFSCRGYTSQSEMWVASRRLGLYHSAAQQIPVIIHLGDHDPSGIDMTRDITNRLNIFAPGKISVDRIALNRDQIDAFNPPPNPAKTTDTRYQTYILEYGEESWELDALEPRVMVDLIEETIMKLKDKDAWAATIEREDEEKAKLQQIADNWE
jgi:hypothetical protein